MLVSRRSLLKAAAAAPALSLPGMLRAQSQTTLRYLPDFNMFSATLASETTRGETFAF